MEPITSNEFLNSVLEAEAWKEISDNESLSMDILDKYADKLDWEEISENRNIIWTLDGINKFANRLNWSDFSQYCADHIINEVTLQKFANRWDWKAISNRDCFYNDWALLEKFADKADWSEVITNWNIEKPLEFFARFQQYIPMAKLRGFSTLELNGRGSCQTNHAGSGRHLLKLIDVNQTAFVFSSRSHPL